MDQSLWIWGIVLILGFPLLTIVLGELSTYLRRHEHILAPFIRDIQRLVLPPLVILLIMRQILGLSSTLPIVAIVETILGIAAVYTALSLIKVVLVSEAKQHAWQISVPNLLFQVIRVAVVLSIVSYVLADVWKVDLSKVFGALGVGSLVLALALQDTLSNLVSGFLLLADRPFKKGDWLKVSDSLDAEVTAINWRSTRLQTKEGTVVIVPNGSLGKDKIFNYSQPTPAVGVKIRVSFSYDDPPNRVKQVLRQIVAETPLVVHSGHKSFATKAFDDYSIQYQIRCVIKDYASVPKALNEFHTRLYYAVKRNGLTMPYPIQHMYTGNLSDIPEEDSSVEIAEYLQSLPYFLSIEHRNIERLARSAVIKHYGIGEQVFQEGEFAGGFYIIQHGSVSLSVQDQKGEKKKIVTLSRGDFFGESVLLPGQLGFASIAVMDDLKVIVLDPDIVANLLPENPKFAKQINELIDERRKAIRRAKGLEDNGSKDGAANSNLTNHSLWEQINS